MIYEFMIILQVIKNQGFTLCLEDTLFEKSKGGGQIDPPQVYILKLGKWQVTLECLREKFNHQGAS